MHDHADQTELLEPTPTDKLCALLAGLFAGHVVVYVLFRVTEALL